MEKIDVIAMAIAVLGIFTFLNILAISVLFRMVDTLRINLDKFLELFNDYVSEQDDFNIRICKISDTNFTLFKQLVKFVGIDINSFSPTGGEEESKSK